jgi:hypothetical protein
MTLGKRKPYRILAHGLGYFCKKLAALVQDDDWQVLDHSGHRPTELLGLVSQLARCDLAYTWGGRISMGKFLWAARVLGKRKLIMLWSGSDVLHAQREYAAGVRVPWISNMVHWGVSPWVAEEVRALGLPCEHVQASFVDVVHRPKALPKKFSVLVYVGDVNKRDLYGWDRMVEVACALPQLEFKLCGIPNGQALSGPPNMKIYPWTADFINILQDSTVVYRPVRHDGLSFTVLEALSHGRHVLYSYPLPGCIHVTGTSDACAELVGLVAAHDAGSLPLNEAGRVHIEQHYAPEHVRADLLRRWERIILS